MKVLEIPKLNKSEDFERSLLSCNRSPHKVKTTARLPESIGVETNNSNRVVDNTI